MVMFKKIQHLFSGLPALVPKNQINLYYFVEINVYRVLQVLAVPLSYMAVNAGL
jgi:hypothetical protein